MAHQALFQIAMLQEGFGYYFLKLDFFFCSNLLKMHTSAASFQMTRI